MELYLNGRRLISTKRYRSPDFGKQDPYKYVLLKPDMFLSLDTERDILFYRNANPIRRHLSTGKKEALRLLSAAHGTFWRTDYEIRNRFLSSIYYLTLVNSADILKAIIDRRASITVVEKEEENGLFRWTINIDYPPGVRYINSFDVRDESHSLTEGLYMSRLIEPAATAQLL